MEATEPETIRDLGEVKQSLKWSAIGHLVLLLVMVIQSLIFPGKPIHYVPTLRVDLVGLPDILKKDLPSVSKDLSLPSKVPPPKALPTKDTTEKVKPASKTVNEAPHPDEMVIKANAKNAKASEKGLEKKNRTALERLKALAKIQDFSEQQTGQGVKIKGNKLSPGTSLTGDAKEALQNSYLDLLRDHLNENFRLTPWLDRQKSLTAKIRIFFDAKGTLRRYKFEKFSGNPQFDEAVKRAVQDSQPFPFPPEDLQSVALNQGILLGFPL